MPHPPAWFTFPRGRTSPVNQNPLPSRVWSTLPSWCIPFSSAWADKKEKNSSSGSSGNSSSTLGYSTAWVENILRCLICTVGKAILTKPINPWASDGTDLIPPAADVPASLCSAVLRYPAHSCALLHFAPPRNTNSHSDAVCSFVRSSFRDMDAWRLRWSSSVASQLLLVPESHFDILPKTHLLLDSFCRICYEVSWRVSDFVTSRSQFILRRPRYGNIFGCPQKIITLVDVLADAAVTRPPQYLNEETLNPQPSSYIYNMNYVSTDESILLLTTFYILWDYNKYKDYKCISGTIQSNHQSPSKEKDGKKRKISGCLFSLAAHVRLRCSSSVRVSQSKKAPTLTSPTARTCVPFFFPFGTLNSWIIRSWFWVSSIYVNLKIGVSNVKHGLFQICGSFFFFFFTVVVLTEQMQHLPAAQTDAGNQHPGGWLRFIILTLQTPYSGLKRLYLN